MTKKQRIEALERRVLDLEQRLASLAHPLPYFAPVLPLAVPTLLPWSVDVAVSTCDMSILMPNRPQ
jgi:hypothetical protein